MDIATSGIVWHPLRYHKRPTALATAWDVACGIILGLWLVLRHRLRIVHARSYVSSMMALAACRANEKEAGRKKALGTPFYAHFSNRKPYQAHIRPKKAQLAALYS